MTQKPRRIDLSPDNFIAGVAGQLTAEQLGVYWLICLLIYSHGGPVEYDEKRFAALLSGTHWRSIRAASERLQELGKITREGSHVMAKGCSEPLQAAFMRVSKASENGVKGGRPRNENNGVEKTDGFHDEKLTRVTPPSPPPPSPPGFELCSNDETPKRASRSKPKTSLPDDFPKEGDLSWARTHWLGKKRADLCSSMDDEVQKFRDHHTAKGTRSGDWSASWRTWAQNAVAFNRENRNGTGTSDGLSKIDRSTLRAAENLAAGGFKPGNDEIRF